MLAILRAGARHSHCDFRADLLMSTLGQATGFLRIVPFSQPQLIDWKRFQSDKPWT